ncbi:zf-HC2 domain-containing protein [Sporichthya sp.]|uniref:zf-HC2 domain-containing protein n=1 Tax=Sporichthya sp. TaxID=65475 RepID=UPI00184B5AC9|nr:zf-HC2 domain-containing protein [Sporichthya sp.]MBA3743831.1 zf-HC2 domain-containing protein [Sporichthya sp.]
MTTPPHDPELDAGQYLGGAMSARHREEFEAHLLGCEECWAEIRAAQAGRALAEMLREAAPQAAREHLRAIAAIEPVSNVGSRSRWRSVPARFAAAAAVFVVGVTVAVSLALSGSGSRSDPLEAAVTVYQTRLFVAEPAGLEPPVRRVGEMAWEGTRAQSLGSNPAVLYRYGDPAGHRLLLVSSPVAFARPAGAQQVGSMKSWTAEIGGAVMFCVDRDGLSWLVISDTREESLSAARAAGLT